MKKIMLLMCILFTSGKIFACICDLQYTTNSFYKADFVAVAEIIKTNENKKENDFFETEILIEQLYKGEMLKSINISGYNNRKQWSSCDIKLIPGGKWLIFGYKDKEGKTFSGYCSMQRADDYNFKTGKFSFILDILKNNIEKSQKKLQYDINFNSNKYQTYDSKKVGDFTLVSVKLDSNLNIEKINFFTDDTQTAKNRIESEIKNFSFVNYLKKNNLKAKDGFFYIFELYPYTNKVEPILRLY